jgi:hypothetical protein
MRFGSLLSVSVRLALKAMLSCSIDGPESLYSTHCTVTYIRLE